MSLTYFSEFNSGVFQLWASDGTAAGSHQVKTFGAGQISQVTMIGARAFFTVDDGSHGFELWVSDGTAAGTTLLDINPGAGSSGPSNLININGTLYFAANDGTHGTEL